MSAYVRAHTWPTIRSLQHPRLCVYLCLILRSRCCTVLRLIILTGDFFRCLCQDGGLEQIDVSLLQGFTISHIRGNKIQLKGWLLNDTLRPAGRSCRAGSTLGRREGCLRRRFVDRTPGAVLAPRLTLAARLTWLLAVALEVLVSFLECQTHHQLV